MPVSSPTSRRKRKSATETPVQKLVARRKKAGPVVDSSCDESLPLPVGIPAPAEKMPGMKQGEGSSVSHSSLSQSSIPPSGESLTSQWSPPSAPPIVSWSPSRAQNGMSPQSPLAMVDPTSAALQLRPEERGLYLIQLLYSCATAVANNNMEITNGCLEQLSQLASLTGDSMQRVATYFMEGLAARSTRSWPGVYKALHSTQYRSGIELLSARQVFFSVCPYLKFAFLTVNQAILDAVECEKVVHIIDLQAADAVQWLALLQALRARPGGPPHLKITGINERAEVLEQVAARLAEEAENLNIRFQFLPVVAKLENVTADMLRVKHGEAVAVSSVMRLHLLLSQEGRFCPNGLGEDTDAQDGHGSRETGVYRRSRTGTFERLRNGEPRTDAGAVGGRERGLKRSRRVTEEGDLEVTRRDQAVVDKVDGFPVKCEGNSVERSEVLSKGRSLSASVGSLQTGRLPGADCEYLGSIEKVLRMLRSLSPRLMVVVEQESSHNSPALLERFAEALHYYCALFDSLDSTLPQLCLERVTLEKHLFGVEIKNIVACEGLERVERHEKLEKWRRRFDVEGFVPLPLSNSTIIQAKRLLSSNSCDGYRLLEKSGCLTLCWQGTPLFAASAWRT